MSERVERTEVEALRARLAAERDRQKELKLALARLRSVAWGSLGRLRAVSAVLAVALAGVVGSGIWWRVDARELPAELRARRDTLRGAVEAERRAIEQKLADAGPDAAARIPAGAYPKLASLRALLSDDQEGILAWTQIGIAACTVEQKDVARMAHRKLELEAQLSRKVTADGKTHPGIARAMTDVDEACRERGIHLLVP